jgi:hypothetical protein
MVWKRSFIDIPHLYFIIQAIPQLNNGCKTTGDLACPIRKIPVCPASGTDAADMDVSRRHTFQYQLLPTEGPQIKPILPIFMVPVRFGDFTCEIDKFCTAGTQGRTDTDPQHLRIASKPVVHLPNGPAKDIVDVPPPPHVYVGDNALDRVHYQDGLTVGNQNHQRHPRNIRYQGIPGTDMQYFRHPVGKTLFIYRQDLFAMNLIQEGQTCRLRVFQEDTPVLLNRVTIVADSQAEVQAGIVTLAATAVSGKDMMLNILN